MRFSTCCAWRWSGSPGRSPRSCAATSSRPRCCGRSAGARLSSRGAARSSTDVQLHRNFVEALERDFTSNHEARHYAAELGVTTGTLSRTLTRLTGRTTKQLILERVLLEAARLLRFSDLSVKEIAARLGFNDQFAFSHAFKRQRGEAPLDFRNRS